VLGKQDLGFGPLSGAVLDGHFPGGRGGHEQDVSRSFDCGACSVRQAVGIGERPHIGVGVEQEGRSSSCSRSSLRRAAPAPPWPQGPRPPLFIISWVTALGRCGPRGRSRLGLRGGRGPPSNRPDVAHAHGCDWHRLPPPDQRPVTDAGRGVAVPDLADSGFAHR
jgi:hypothetical protein